MLRRAARPGRFRFSTTRATSSSLLLLHLVPQVLMSTLLEVRGEGSRAEGALYRADGVRITHDPYAPEMARKYGLPGHTDREGFDPYADSVGAGIYSGTVRRGPNGHVTIGQQYQNHNPRPGPVYAGGGYTPVSKAIASFHAERQRGIEADKTTLGSLLSAYPDLVNDVSTGGALPLHTCGMSQANQHAAAYLISRGADVESVDTYGFTPLHRMASNNLPVGAKALLVAGADPLGLTASGIPSVTSATPLEIAKQSHALDVVAVLQSKRHRKPSQVNEINIIASGYAPVVGRYTLRNGERDIPQGFADVCEDNAWDTEATWNKLNGGERKSWWGHEDSNAYIYFNSQDQCWWIDGPDGLGAYKARGPAWAPPASSLAWKALRKFDDSAKNSGGPLLLTVTRAPAST